MTNTEATDRDRLLNKVRKLLDKAASTNFDKESETYMMKADSLMREYAIKEFELQQSDPSRKHDPEIRDFDMPAVKWDDETLALNLARLFKALANNCGVNVVNWGYSRSKSVGWPEDLDYLEMLFMQITVDMLGQMKPKWDLDLEVGENVHNFKLVGYKWADIWDAWQHALHPDPEDQAKRLPWDRKHGSKMLTPYKRYVAKHDLERQTATGLKGYRDDFGFGYVMEIERRLREVHESRAEETKHNELVLVSRKSALEDFLSIHFPPPKVTATTRNRRAVAKATRKFNPNAAAAGKRAGANADIGLTGINK